MKTISFPAQATYYIIYNSDKSIVHNGVVNVGQELTTPLDNMDTYLIESDYETALLDNFNRLVSSQKLYWISYTIDRSKVQYDVLQPQVVLIKPLDVIETFTDKQAWITKLAIDFRTKIDEYRYF
jgi:hypothetical protein